MMRGFGYYGSGYGMMGGGWLGFLLMLLLWAVLIAGVVVLVVWAVRASRHGHVPPVGGVTGPVDPAIDLARKRLASGEITKEQFDEIMTSLRS